MQRVAQFYKVSYDQFKSAIQDMYVGQVDVNEQWIENIYEYLETPKRATKGSAGYDFYAPFSFDLEPGESIKIPTGIRCGMHNDWVLMLFPRSSLGFKYRLKLNNTVGIVDSDYFYADNEGHIFVKLTNEGKDKIVVTQGDAFCQGILLPFGITDDDNVTASRHGGFGSTDKKSE